MRLTSELRSAPLAGRSLITLGGWLLALMPLFLSGCATIASSAASGFAGNLSTAILDQEDPELVREATPAYLLLLDSFAKDSKDPDVLGAAAELYAAYGTLFVTDAERAMTLTSQARNYGRQALCAADRNGCGLENLDFDAYAAAVGELSDKSADALYSYSLGELAYIQAHSGDFVALADLPKAETALVRLEQVAPEDRLGDVYKYLGILNTLRPPALGGQPEKGRDYFERALTVSGDRDLSIRVEYARGYARLVYDRDLHDRLLNEVLAGEVKQPGFTLFNNLAQEQARELLDSADDFF